MGIEALLVSWVGRESSYPGSKHINYEITMNRKNSHVPLDIKETNNAMNVATFEYVWLYWSHVTGLILNQTRAKSAV